MNEALKVLKKKYPASEFGTWIVFGADTNFDFAGTHEKPILKYAEGKYRDVLKYAKGLSGFEVYSSYGDIAKIEVTKLLPQK